MTAADILAKPKGSLIYFKGDEIAGFCDLFQKEHQQPATWPNWTMIRGAAYIIGIPHPPPFVDEIVRMHIGQALGYDWYIPA